MGRAPDRRDRQIVRCRGLERQRGRWAEQQTERQEVEQIDRQVEGRGDKGDS